MAESIIELVSVREVRSPRQARVAASMSMSGRCGADLLEDVLVVVSELVTNALGHTGGRCSFAVQQVDGGHFVIEVCDSDERPQRRRADDKELGRGLGIVQTLAHRWGIEKTPDGKCVWAEFVGCD